MSDSVPASWRYAFRAVAARFEMVLDVGAAARFAVVVEDEIVFVVVRHAWRLRTGSSATLSFFTALNTLCFAALVPRPSARLISSIDRPS